MECRRVKINKDYDGHIARASFLKSIRALQRGTINYFFDIML